MEQEDIPEAETLPPREMASSPLRVTRTRVVSRLWRAAERQVNEIEARLTSGIGQEAELERDAKTLAIIAKTVRDLVAIDAEKRSTRKPRETARKHDENTPSPDCPGQDALRDDDAPRDLDAFRRELARRLDQLRQGGEGEDAAEQS